MGRVTPRRGVPVTLDRERRIRYPMAAVAAINDRYGVDIMAGGQVPMNRLDDVLWLVWLGLKYGEEDAPAPSLWDRLLVRLGLREAEPELTPEFVAEAMDLENMEAVTQALTQAMGVEIKGEMPKARAGNARAAS